MENICNSIINKIFIPLTCKKLSPINKGNNGNINSEIGKVSKQEIGKRRNVSGQLAYVGRQVGRQEGRKNWRKQVEEERELSGGSRRGKYEEEEYEGRAEKGKQRKRERKKREFHCSLNKLNKKLENGHSCALIYNIF